MIDLTNRYILTKDHVLIDLSKYDTSKIWFEPWFIKGNIHFSMKHEDETILMTSQIKNIVTEPTYAIDSTNANQRYEVMIDYKLKGVVFYDKDRGAKYIETIRGKLDFEKVRHLITKAIVTWQVKGGNLKTKILFSKDLAGNYKF